VGRLHIILIGLMLVPALSSLESAFNGTWRPDPEKPNSPGKPDVFELVNGVYDCRTCQPPYKVKADGQDQAVEGNRYYDTISIRIVDERTVIKTAKKNGKAMADITVTVSADGSSETEVQMVTGMSPAPIEVTNHLSRVADGPPGAHRISGGWQLIESEVSNHAEDTTFKISGNTLIMSDKMGESFSATLDGTAAPYKGNPQYTDVSVKMLDSRTIEESDMNGGKVVLVRRWSLGPDSNSMHARFDDTHGHIQEQWGHKIQQ
jgi:hypothetical protein